MRPSDAFGCPRPVGPAGSDAAGTPLASGSSGPVGRALAGGPVNTISTMAGIGGPSITAAPMMSYFLAEEADVDAALDAAGRDADSFKLPTQHARPLRGSGKARTDLPRPGASTDSATVASPDLHDPDLDHSGTDADTDADANIDADADADTADHLADTTHDPSHANHQHQTFHYSGHRHTPSTDSTHAHGPFSGLPPALSPVFSQSTSTSLFGTPGPASLSAMSSPSSRRNSLSSSFLMDDRLSSGGGDGNIISRDPSFVMESGAMASIMGGIGFGPSTTASAGTDTTTAPRNTDAIRIPSDVSAAAAPATGPCSASYLLSSSAAGLSTANNNTMMDSGSAPQLIMPSIKMPSRRPFTDMGKHMGRLKVLIAGDSGIGKTSLIKAIVQSCQHIVHVDHITPTALSLDVSRRSSAATVQGSPGIVDAGQASQNTIRSRRRSSRSPRSDLSTSHITEIYASTKPYPAWWTEVADFRGLRRRKSLGDNVLDRNICFVDTPGFTGKTAVMDIIMPVAEYVEGYWQKLCSNALSDTDFVSLVSGDGGASVDVVFYLVSNSLKPADIEYLRRLTPLTNVIPLLARADTLRSEKEVAEAKDRIARQLHEANIKPFVFTMPTEAHELALMRASESGLPQPYAVSSANGSDHDVMDASLLMSPDYVQPLVATDLAALVEHVFCQDGIARLRHAAAQKFARWRKSEYPNNGSGGSGGSSANNNSHSSRPQSLYRPLSFGGAGDLGILSGSNTGNIRPSVLTTPLGAPSSFALARVTDHAQREEQLARIRLANWAAELQRNLDSERARYEKLAHSERAVWLTERLSECVQDGTLVAVPPAANSATAVAAFAGSGQRKALGSSKQQTKSGKVRKNKTRGLWPSSASSVSATSSSSRSLSVSLSHEDPLGLLEVTAGLRARGLFILELLGSLSVLGGAAFWLARHNYHLHVYEWVMDEWARLWNSER